MTPDDAAPRPGDVMVLAGTQKGLFAFRADEGRRDWRFRHHHSRLQVHASAHDPRDNALYAATNSFVYGGIVQRSNDWGATWEKENSGLNFEADSEYRVEKVWQVHAGERPGVVYAGTERAGIFRSEDGGVAWTGLALNHHPNAPDWQPGGGGLCLHTILQHPTDPNRMWVAISTGGVYRTDDGGATWTARNHGIDASFLPEPTPDFGQCVHKVDLHPSQPDLLYLQNHGGVYRSVDAGDNWTSIAEGLPADFGFPIVVHPHDPNQVYVVPLNADVDRYVVDSQMSVWRGDDRGDRWTQLADGLPNSAYLVILRDGMAVDDCDEHGIYVGTNTGHLFYSRDEGKHWQMLAEYLPPIYSVVTTRVAG